MKNPFTIQKDKSLAKHAMIENYSRKKHEGEEWFVDEQRQPLKKLVSNKRVQKFFWLIMLGLLILTGRLFWLQIVKGGYYRDVAEGNRIRIEDIKANRGLIYDKNENLLVKNVPVFYLTVIPADLPEDEEELKENLAKLSEIIKDDLIKENIKQIVENTPSYSYQPIVVKEYIEPEKAILLEIEKNNFPGVKLKIRTGREYLINASLSHALGYVGKITQEEWKSKQKEDYSLDDYIGKTGLEFYYESTLKGAKGKRRIEVDSMGREREVLNSEAPQSGDGLVLSLDIDLQKKLAESLQNHIERVGVAKGTAIAMDPRNGEILAIASLPGFDNNLFVTGISVEEYKSLINNPDKPLFFRTISGEYPPGSTIKPLVALAAMEEGIITPWTTTVSYTHLTLPTN